MKKGKFLYFPKGICVKISDSAALLLVLKFDKLLSVFYFVGACTK